MKKRKPNGRVLREAREAWEALQSKWSGVTVSGDRPPLKSSNEVKAYVLKSLPCPIKENYHEVLRLVLQGDSQLTSS